MQSGTHLLQIRVFRVAWAPTSLKSQGVIIAVGRSQLHQLYLRRVPAMLNLRTLLFLQINLSSSSLFIFGEYTMVQLQQTTPPRKPVNNRWLPGGLGPSEEWVKVVGGYDGVLTGWCGHIMTTSPYLTVHGSLVGSRKPRKFAVNYCSVSRWWCLVHHWQTHALNNHKAHVSHIRDLVVVLANDFGHVQLFSA